MTELNQAGPKKWEIMRLPRSNETRILDSLEDGVYISNQGYELEYVNSALQSGFGAVEGRKCYQYFHNREKPCPWCLNQFIWAGKSTRQIYSTKSHGTYDEISTPLRSVDGSISKLAIFRDITEHKKTEEKI